MSQNYFVNEAIENIWKDRYCKNDETLDENFRRVAKFAAKNSQQEEEFYKMLSEGRAFPGGRTMSNAGIGSTLSLNNCFKAGTKVITSDGLKNIEDVSVGDMVVGESGEFHRVNEIMVRDYVGDIFCLKSKFLYGDIYCTPNHNFLTQNGWVRADRLMIGSRVAPQDKLKTPKLIFKKEYKDVDITSWFEGNSETRLHENADGKVVIEKLCNRNPHNDNVNWTRVNKPVNRYIHFTPEFRYFIGRWLGDGSITRYKGKRNHSIVQIVFNATTEREMALKCKEIGDHAFGLEAEWRETNQNIIALRWNNELLGTWFYHELGEKCTGKRLDKKYIGDLEIAKGLFDADGFVDTHGAGRLTLKNRHLVEWFRDTMFLNGYNTSRVKEAKEHADTFNVNYGTASGKKGFNKEIHKQYYDKRIGKEEIGSIYTDYIYIDDIEILEDQRCKVYNLSVETDHSYTANGVVVHNCFVSPPIIDDLGDIFKKVALGAKTHQSGGKQFCHPIQ